MAAEVERRRLCDFQWFIDNYMSIYERYGECYVAIRNKKIIGIFDSFGDACCEMDKTSRPTDQIIQYCNGDQSGYTAYFYGISPI